MTTIVKNHIDLNQIVGRNANFQDDYIISLTRKVCSRRYDPVFQMDDWVRHDETYWSQFELWSDWSVDTCRIPRPSDAQDDHSDFQRADSRLGAARPQRIRRRPRSRQLN